MQGAVRSIQADLLSQSFFTRMMPPWHTHAQPKDFGSDPEPRFVVSHSLASYNLLHDHHLHVDLSRLALASKKFAQHRRFAPYYVLPVRNIMFLSPLDLALTEPSRPPRATMLNTETQQSNKETQTALLQVFSGALETADQACAHVPGFSVHTARPEKAMKDRYSLCCPRHSVPKQLDYRTEETSIGLLTI